MIKLTILLGPAALPIANQLTDQGYNLPSDKVVQWQKLAYAVRELREAGLMPEHTAINTNRKIVAQIRKECDIQRVKMTDKQRDEEP